ncbi:hypothetical protein Y600_6400 [Burkholderia pseudomallei MSHR3709]|nr:hypothetical protein Y600_6400 [Burkholderia pseudomallei MSHR3709]
MRISAATLIRQVATAQGHVRAARQIALIVDDRARRTGFHSTLGADGRAGKVRVARRRGHAQVAVGGRRAVRKIDAAAGEGRVTGCAVGTRRGHLAAARDAQVAARSDRAVGVDACAKGARRIEATDVGGQVLLGGQRAAVDQVRARVDRDRLLAIRDAAVLNATRG